MNSVSCLALILFMESRGESLLTQQYVASVAIERAKQEAVPLCQSMKKPRAYSWLWDGVRTKVDPKQMDALKQVAVKELANPTLKGRMFFNEKRMGRRYRTPHKTIVSGNLIFY